MAQHTPFEISSHFAPLKDPRTERWPQHELPDMLVIALSAIICGANDWVAVETFGKAQREWLGQFLELRHGIPSHDTFGRVFAALDPEVFSACFINWTQAISQLTQGEVVALDGKTLRRSYDSFSGQKAIHMVSAWANQAHLVLGQVKVDDKSNEITAIPALLELLVLKGCIVTIDAMGCQKEIAQQIIDQEADYVLALKGNQGQLYDEVRSLFEDGRKTEFTTIPAHFHQTVDKGHGRLEIRRHWLIDDPAYLDYLDPQRHWPGLRSVAMVEAERRIGDQISRETRFYIASWADDPVQLAHAARAHWGIENKVHWTLDVTFREDDCRVRQGYGAQNLATLRHMALNLLKNETSAKLGIQNKRLRAAWDPAYLLEILSSLS